VPVVVDGNRHREAVVTQRLRQQQQQQQEQQQSSAAVIRARSVKLTIHVLCDERLQTHSNSRRLNASIL
jgi:hypothetical protein